jgi:hypothetical protein
MGRPKNLRRISSFRDDGGIGRHSRLLWSREAGNDSRDALKFGGLFTDNAEPSRPAFEPGGRCRDWTGAAYVERAIGSRHSPDHKRDAVAKAIVVRKFAARKGVRVRVPVIPNIKNVE